MVEVDEEEEEEKVDEEEAHREMQVWIEVGFGVSRSSLELMEVVARRQGWIERSWRGRGTSMAFVRETRRKEMK